MQSSSVTQTKTEPNMNAARAAFISECYAKQKGEFASLGRDKKLGSMSSKFNSEWKELTNERKPQYLEMAKERQATEAATTSNAQTIGKTADNVLGTLRDMVAVYAILPCVGGLSILTACSRLSVLYVYSVGQHAKHACAWPRDGGLGRSSGAELA